MGHHPFIRGDTVYHPSWGKCIFDGEHESGVPYIFSTRQQDSGYLDTELELLSFTPWPAANHTRHGIPLVAPATPTTKINAIGLAVEAMLKIGGPLHVKPNLDIKRPETIRALNTFGEALLDAYNRGFADAQKEKPP